MVHVKNDKKKTENGDSCAQAIKSYDCRI